MLKHTRACKVGSKDWLAQQMNQKNGEIALLKEELNQSLARSKYLESCYDSLLADYIAFRCVSGSNEALSTKLKGIQDLCINSRGEIHYYVDDFIESVEEILEK